MSELVTHAVRHGGRLLELDIRATDGHVHGEVRASDHGLSWTPAQDPRADGDWGVYLVNRLTDRWGKRRVNGSELWFEIEDAAA